MDTFPYVSEELLRGLKEAFPDRLPDSTRPPHEMGVLIGQQKVIRFLEKHHQEQMEQMLQGEGG